MLDKTSIKVIIDAILDREAQKAGRNLRTIRLTLRSKNFLIKAGFLTEEGHFYTKKLNHLF